MRSYVIALSTEPTAPLMQSCHAHDMPLPSIFPAVRPEDVADVARESKSPWVMPEHGRLYIDGLCFHAYKNRDPLARQACFWSHATLWRRCSLGDEPFLILESDALFIRHFDPAELDDCGFGMVSLNSPHGATRKADIYSDALTTAYMAGDNVVEVPWVDQKDTPQGLPGHSAYVLFPWFAAELLAKAEQVGAMPNDALACRQFFPGKLGCITKYATKVSGRPSSLA